MLAKVASPQPDDSGKKMQCNAPVRVSPFAYLCHLSDVCVLVQLSDVCVHVQQVPQNANQQPHCLCQCCAPAFLRQLRRKKEDRLAEKVD